MISRKSTFFLGIFIFLIPFLGVPTSWKTTLIVSAGIILTLLSIRVVMPRKAVRPRVKRERVTPEVPVIFPRNTMADIKKPETNLENDQIEQ
jgi:hypothetical protein